MRKSRKRGAGGKSTSNKAKSLILYMGGKYKLLPKILSLVRFATAHHGLTSYREWCGGSGKVLMNLPPDLFEEERWYNDLNVGLAQLMAAVGDPEGVYALQDILFERDIGEGVFLTAKEEELMGENVSIMMSAANAFILSTQSYAASMKSYDPSLDWDLDRIAAYYARIEKLASFQEILDGIKVTSRNCLELLEECQHDDHAICFLDPPYTPEAMRGQNHYGERSWGVWEHQMLVMLLLETEMQVVLSGYDTAHYLPLEEAGWNKIHLGEIAVTSSGAARARANEFVWINFDIPDELLEKVSEPEPEIHW